MAVSNLILSSDKTLNTMQSQPAHRATSEHPTPPRACASPSYSWHHAFESWLVRAKGFKSFKLSLRPFFFFSLHTMPLGKRKAGADDGQTELDKLDELSHDMAVACNINNIKTMRLLLASTIGSCRCWSRARTCHPLTPGNSP